MLGVLAAELGVVGNEPVGKSSADLRARTLAALGGTDAVLLVLDNLETPWQSDSLGSERLLADVVALANLSLVASIRGHAWPGNVGWLRRFDVPPLGRDDARRVFTAVAGNEFAADPDLPFLLEQMDGIPLAVELLATAVQGQPDLADLATRWRRERAAMLRRGPADHRQLSLPISLEISILGSSMTAEGLRLLSLLGVLPDGVSRDELDELLPGAGTTGAATLRRLGLAYDEAGRVRTLGPVREHVAAVHPPSMADLETAVGLYCRRASVLGDLVGRAGGAEAVAVLTAETGNLRTVILEALDEDRQELAEEAVLGMAKLELLTGVAVPGILEEALEALYEAGERRPWVQRPAILAQLHVATGHIALRHADIPAAQRAYQRALALYEKIEDVVGQANCIRSLGDIALRHTDNMAAERAYQRALELYEQVDSVLGRANCIRSLGDIALRRADDADARDAYQQALPLYIQVGDVRGRANCIKRLGDIALRHADQTGAEEAYRHALNLYEDVGDILGQANCRRSLGDIALRRLAHTEAADAYQHALTLYAQVGAVLGQANCIKRLGDIAVRCGDRRGAHEAYQRSLALFEQAGSIAGQANCIRSLGHIASDRSDRLGARDAYRKALSMFERIPDPYSIGWTNFRLAQVAENPADRARHVDAARRAWAGIDRPDLVAQLDTEFGPDTAN
jgi:tetratricopeptide (TPR) repeat protein